MDQKNPNNPKGTAREGGSCWFPISRIFLQEWKEDVPICIWKEDPLILLLQGCFGMSARAAEEPWGRAVPTSTGDPVTIWWHSSAQ